MLQICWSILHNNAINDALSSLEKVFFCSLNRPLARSISVGARDFSPDNISIWGTSVFGFAYAVTGKSPAPNKISCSPNSDLLSQPSNVYVTSVSAAPTKNPPLLFVNFG